MEQKRRILVVDDEETLSEALRFSLESEGYDVDVAYSAEEALGMNLEVYDIFLLDIMMGEISGTGLARMIKSNRATATRPIIFCTARDAEEDMIKGLDMGADDYITKPYSLKAVSARVRAVLRRTDAAREVASGESADALVYDGLMIMPGKKQCVVDGREVVLPKKEFEILRMLMGKRGHIFTREELLRSIWPDEVVVLDRVVDVNITRIRQKIGRYGKNIVTRCGYGYGFME